MKNLRILFFMMIFSYSSFAEKTSFNYYSIPLTKELAEAVLEVAKSRDLRIDEVMRFGFVFMDKESTKIVKSENGEYLIQAMMTNTNALVMLSWISRHQFKNGFLGAAEKSKIVKELNDRLDDPASRKNIQIERRLDQEIQKVRDKYR
ncbi:MAG: hypothetical protein V4640_13085 [Verrucomicrobiota bacterium]